MPVNKDLLKICESIGAISLITDLSKALLILSKPQLLLIFRSLVIFIISSVGLDLGRYYFADWLSLEGKHNYRQEKIFFQLI